MTYSGPERRWMTRSLYTWQDRLDQHDNQFALKEARSIAVLEKMLDRVCKRKRGEESDALWDAIWELRRKLDKHREGIATDVAPWFDGSSFTISCDHE